MERQYVVVRSQKKDMHHWTKLPAARICLAIAVVAGCCGAYWQFREWRLRQAHMTLIGQGTGSKHDELVYLIDHGDRRSVPYLIHALRNFEPSAPGEPMVCTKAHCLRALRRITGTFAGQNFDDWAKWWQSQGERLLPGDSIQASKSATTAPQAGDTPGANSGRDTAPVTSDRAVATTEPAGMDERLGAFGPYSLAEYELTDRHTLPSLSGRFSTVKFTLKAGEQVNSIALRERIINALHASGWHQTDFDESAGPNWGKSPDDVMMKRGPVDENDGIHTYFQRVHVADDAHTIVIYLVAYWS